MSCGQIVMRTQLVCISAPDMFAWIHGPSNCATSTTFSLITGQALPWPKGNKPSKFMRMLTVSAGGSGAAAAPT